MAILKHFWLLAALLLACIAPSAAEVKTVPADLFPGATKVWLYTDATPRGMTFDNNGPVLPRKRHLLRAADVEEMRGAVFYRVSDAYIVDKCVHPLHYVFGFENDEGRQIGLLLAYTDSHRPVLLPAPRMEPPGMLDLDRGKVERLAARYLKPQRVAQIEATKGC